MTCSGIVEIVCDILKWAIKQLTASWVPFNVQRVENADNFLRNHLLFLKATIYMLMPSE